MKDSQEKIENLKRKLSQTEARVTSRLIVSAQQVLPTECLELLLKQFEENKSLDLLEIEKQVADNAREKADMLTNVFEAVKEYKEVCDLRRGMEEKTYLEETEQKHRMQKINQIEQRKIRCREKMFSLIDEIKLKEHMSLFV